MLPEPGYVIAWDDHEIACTSPSGDRRAIAWDDLQSVMIVTTDTGPFVTDVFWVLEGSSSTCAIPQGATGEDELLGRLQELPGFDSRAVTAAMCSTNNAEFRCWHR